MPDEDLDTTGDETEGAQDSGKELARAKIARLQSEADAGKQAQRKLAMLEAGLDLSNPQQAYFAETYQGDLTAVKDKATELGFLKEPEPPTPKAEQEGLARMTAVSAGGGTPPATVDFKAEINKAQTSQEIAEIVARARAAGVGPTSR